MLSYLGAFDPALSSKPLTKKPPTLTLKRHKSTS